KMQLGAKGRARDKGLRERLVGEAILQDQRLSFSLRALQPRALLKPAILVIYPLTKHSPTVGDMLAARSQLVLRERPAHRLPHIIRQSLVPRVLPAVGLNQQRETPQLAKELYWPVIRRAGDARHAPQSPSDARSLGVGHASRLRLPEAGGLPFQRADAIAH